MSQISYSPPTTEIKYGYLLYIPENFTIESQLVLWGHGSTPPDIEYSQQHEFCKDSLSIIIPDLDQYGMAAVMPLLPRQYQNRDYPFFKYDSQIMTQETMTVDDQPQNFYSRPDKVILQILTKVKYDLGRSIDEKIVIGGISAGANMANRMALLYPHMFSAMVLLLAGDYIYPEDMVDNLELDYPFGISDIDSISGHQFDRDKFLQIPQYIYIGGQYESKNDPLPYELNFSVKRLPQFKAVLGENPLTRAQHYYEYLKSHGVNAKLSINMNTAHSVDGTELKSAFGFLAK